MTKLTRDVAREIVTEYWGTGGGRRDVARSRGARGALGAGVMAIVRALEAIT